jgi:hypothetical protein
MRLSISRLKSSELFASLWEQQQQRCIKSDLEAPIAESKLESTAIRRFDDGQGLWNPFTAIGTASDLLGVDNLRRGTASMLQDWRPYLA